MNNTGESADQFKTPFTKITYYCAVCKDLAAGFHFGAWTCEGCKSFFGRMCKPVEKRNRTRTCTGQKPALPIPVHPLPMCKTLEKKCLVTGRNRTVCKLCRWNKCLEAKMSRNSSRYGRRSNYFKVSCAFERRESEKLNLEKSQLNSAVVKKENQSSFNDHQFELNLKTATHNSIAFPSIFNPFSSISTMNINSSLYYRRNSLFHNANVFPLIYDPIFWLSQFKQNEMPSIKSEQSVPLDLSTKKCS